MTPLNILGLDPGVTGGIAVITCMPGDPTPQSYDAWPMPQTEREICDLLASLSNERVRAYLERVASRPQQGVASTFRFGMNYGLPRGLLIALKIPFEAVTPGTWQRNLGCLTGGDKKVTRRKAQELFPAAKITNATADAILIAEYGRRAQLG